MDISEASYIQVLIKVTKCLLSKAKLLVALAEELTEEERPEV